MRCIEVTVSHCTANGIPMALREAAGIMRPNIHLTKRSAENMSLGVANVALGAENTAALGAENTNCFQRVSPNIKNNVVFRHFSQKNKNAKVMFHI